MIEISAIDLMLFLLIPFVMTGLLYMIGKLEGSVGYLRLESDNRYLKEALHKIRDEVSGEECAEIARRTLDSVS